MSKKTIIVGAGLGGLITGIMLKRTDPSHEVVIFDGNKIPGGFCNSFQKVANVDGEKVKYTINIPVVTSDFRDGEPFDMFLKYMGVPNLNWRVVEKPFQYYPLDEAPFLFTQNGVEDLLERTPDTERKQAKEFFDHMKKFYNEVFHKANSDPNPLQEIKMLFTIPTTVKTMLQNKTYKKHIRDSGIKTKVIQEIFSITEGFMGVEVEQASAVGELLMIQSFFFFFFLQPAEGDTFQTLSDRLAQRFEELGGKIHFKKTVDSVIFDTKKATGVMINGKSEYSDYIVLSVAQDRIKSLVSRGTHIPRVNKLVNKITDLPYPNSDFYSYYLVDKSLFEQRPDFTDILYHIYRKKDGIKKGEWNLFTIIPDEIYNEKYYLLAVLYIEHDQSKIDSWFRLRETDYPKYKKEKENFAGKILEELQDAEPLFEDSSKIHHVLSMSPASYLEYGSRFPISGLAQTPDNFGMKRMKQVVLDNLFISGGASFSAGVWGSIAGGWQGFTSAYEKMYGVKIGNNEVLYKPGIKNLPD